MGEWFEIFDCCVVIEDYFFKIVNVGWEFMGVGVYFVYVKYLFDMCLD